MAQLTRTWWGKRFIEALEAFTDPGRLGRGRSYARGGRILSHTFDKGKVKARVEGKINPYFGVYETPIYNTEVQITPIPDKQWVRLIKHLAGSARCVAQLLMNEMPDNIEDSFAELNLALLPHSEKDFKTRCSCPDYWNPCKHIAGVCYFLAARLDQDPFLMFELRGLSRQRLRAELEKTPLGKTLAASLETEEPSLQPALSYYTRPTRMAAPEIDYNRFWRGEKRLPATLPPAQSANLPAVLIRKGGDYPPFWNKDASFIDVMTECYERIRKHNKDVL
jgi:uncharacterized Zn finger protein